MTPVALWRILFFLRIAAADILPNKLLDEALEAGLIVQHGDNIRVGFHVQLHAVMPGFLFVIAHLGNGSLCRHGVGSFLAWPALRWPMLFPLAEWVRTAAQTMFAPGAPIIH